MKKLLAIVVLGLLWCNTSFAEQMKEPRKIYSASREYIILKHSLFSSSLSHWRTNIPNNAIAHCKSFKKNTYKFIGDDFQSGGGLSILIPSGSEFYRYVCAEDEDDAVRIRAELIKEKNKFNKGANHWKENNTFFKSHMLKSKHEWFESEAVKRTKAKAKAEALKRKQEEEEARFIPLFPDSKSSSGVGDVLRSILKAIN